MSNTDTARSAYAMFRAGDMGGLKDLFTHDATWYSSDEIPLGGELHGADAILEMMSRIPDHWSEVTIEPSTYLAADDYVIVLGTQRFTNTKGTAQTPFAQVLKFDGAGKVVRSDLFGDTAKMAKLQT